MSLRQTSNGAVRRHGVWKVFVAYPYTDAGREMAERQVTPILKRAGFDPVHGPFHGACVVASIRQAIERCDGLVAVLPELNPNVFFEIGVASTLGKPCVLIAASKSDLAMLDGAHPSILDFDESHGRSKLENILDEWRSRLSHSAGGSEAERAASSQ